jgi:hypothetical protein
MVEQQTRNLREDLSRNIKATRQDFETQLAALEARTKRAGGGSAGANADKVKAPKFDGSTSWVVFIVSLKLRPSITFGRPERRPLTF